MSWEPIGLPRIEWGLTLCHRQGCAELAVLAFEGWPYCLDHGEEAFDFEVAREIDPGLADLLLQARE